jgi:tetratricopeptide (TPR) repeat protein
MRGMGWRSVVLLVVLGLAAPVTAVALEELEVGGPLVAETGAAASAPPRRGFEVERAWFGAGAALPLRASETRRRSLELGATNLEPAARALVAADVAEGEAAVEHARHAVRLAPDLPLARMALASAHLGNGEYRGAIAQVIASVLAIPRHLEASLWLAGSLLVVLAVVLITASVGFIVAVGTAGFSRAAHDIGDLVSSHTPGFARAALLCAVIGVPLALGEGMLGLLLGVLAIGVVYGGPRHRAVLAMSAMLMMIGLYPVLQVAGMALGALDADPVASASLAAVRGSESPAQVALLQEAELQGDELAARVLAVRALRLGELEQASDRFTRLFEEEAADPLVLTALGNMAFRAGDNVKAIDYYERAKAVEESAILMFDLSQAYARAFRMEEFEWAMQRAQALDYELVAELSDLGDPDFVADAAFPIAPIRSRMLSAADGRAFVDAVVSRVAPGRLGESPGHVGGALALVFLAGLLLTSRYQHAGRCSRCGRRICARCDDSMWSADLCDGCHHLFNRPQGTDPYLRMARLKALRAREGRIEKLATAASLLVPGVSGLLARRPDLSFVSLVLFATAATLFFWHGGVVPDPLAVGHAGPLVFLVVGTGAALLYAGVVLTGIVIRRSQ